MTTECHAGGALLAGDRGACLCLGDCCNDGEYCVCPDEIQEDCHGLHRRDNNVVEVPKTGTYLVTDGVVRPVSSVTPSGAVRCAYVEFKRGGE